MAGHRMIGVAEQHFTILHRYAHSTQATGKSMPKVMDAHRSEADFAPRSLPCGVVHRVNRLAPMWENPDGILATLFFNDRPSDVVQDDDVRSLRLERIGRNDKHTPVYFWNDNFPSPLKTANVGFAKPGIDRK
jgi:hypothetical protein